jgi:hypothetical protein
MDIPAAPTAPDLPRAAGRSMTLHYEASAAIAADPAALFDRLDDQTRLGAHMAEPTLMMGGGKMTYAFDEGRGRTVGSHIKMEGAAFGLKLSADEVVTERKVPRRKVWKTVGSPKLLIIDAYEMGFEISPAGAGATLRVWIDYATPGGLVGAIAGRPLAEMYARWCVDRMVTDAQLGFATA